MEWSTNHGGDHFVKIVPLSMESEIEGLASEDLIHHTTYAVDVATTMVNIPSDLLPGMYLVQYGWSGYRNCITVDARVAEDMPDGGAQGLEGPETILTAEDNVNCVSLCEDFTSFCAEIPVDQPYADLQDCLGKCATFPVGTVGDWSTDVANSLNCRWHHLHVEGGLPSEHCPHASYNHSYCSGGDFLPAIAVVVISVANTAEEIQAELQTAFEASYDNVVVAVVTGESVDEFIVTVQLDGTEAAQEEEITQLLTGNTFQSIVDGTSLEVESAAVIGALDDDGSSAGRINGNIIAAAVAGMILAF